MPYREFILKKFDFYLYTLYIIRFSDRFYDTLQLLLSMSHTLFL